MQSQKLSSASYPLPWRAMLLPRASWWSFPALLVSLELWSPEFHDEGPGTAWNNTDSECIIEGYYIIHWELGRLLFPNVFKLSFAGLPRATGPRQCRALPRHQIPQKQGHSAPSQAHHSMSMATGGCCPWKKPGQKQWSCQQAGRPGQAMQLWPGCCVAHWLSV